ncbi:putative membrane-associated kinase regulator 3 [Glycine max]|nr:putative membrane-associated kinase regulator 3 [Glycine max]
MERSPQQHEMAKKKVSLVDVDKNYIDTPSQNKEFEFQTKKVSLRTRYPADELFFKGKLLPLNLLPRVQMVEKLIENADATTPLQAWTISPSESRKTKRFRLAQRLKASKTYVKTLFNKYGCYDNSCANDAATSHKKNVKDDARKNKNPFEFFGHNKHQRQRSCVVKNNDDMLEDGFINSNKRSCELQLAEQENSINSAISNCKKSQQQGSSNKVCSQSLVCGNKEITGLIH